MGSLPMRAEDSELVVGFYFQGGIGFFKVGGISLEDYFPDGILEFSGFLHVEQGEAFAAVCLEIFNRLVSLSISNQQGEIFNAAVILETIALLEFDDAVCQGRRIFWRGLVIF